MHWTSVSFSQIDVHGSRTKFGACDGLRYGNVEAADLEGDGATTEGAEAVVDRVLELLASSAGSNARPLAWSMACSSALRMPAVRERPSACSLS
jgi:hypothetical protein